MRRRKRRQHDEFAAMGLVPVRVSHEKRQCEHTGKRGFRSRTAAKRALKAVFRKGANTDRLRIYRCPHCHDYHLSSSFQGGR